MSSDEADIAAMLAGVDSDSDAGPPKTVNARASSAKGMSQALWRGAFICLLAWHVRARSQRRCREGGKRRQ